MDLLFPCGSWAILDFQLLLRINKEKKEKETSTRLIRFDRWFESNTAKFKRGL